MHSKIYIFRKAKTINNLVNNLERRKYKAPLCLCMPTGVGIKLGSIVLRFTSIYDETSINRLVKPQQI